ncbi:uncharacterized protein LOC110855024 [Folsomia candida]|uniref:uncharacterized protein LOC110855024 n=1 Tax=Folsomia candida TaxID=158441 RepID=UPI000B909A0E|nr:uncharacterized protein LOC110855024 [Folsomia candida]
MATTVGSFGAINSPKFPVLPPLEPGYLLRRDNGFIRDENLVKFLHTGEYYKDHKVRRKLGKHGKFGGQRPLPPAPTIPQSAADQEFDDFQRAKLFGTLVAMIGSSGLIVPLLTAAILPFELLNPNLLLAKSLALLAIPVGVMSYGRSLKDDHTHREKRSIVFFNRLFNPPATNFNLKNVSSPENSTLAGSTTPTTTTMRPVLSITAAPPQWQQQCIQRLACQGFRLEPLPVFLLRETLKLSGGNTGAGNSSSSTVDGGGVVVARANRPRHKKGSGGKRKNLAKYALGKIKVPVKKGAGGSSSSSEVPEIPPDLEGWFNPAPNPPITTTTRKPRPTTEAEVEVEMGTEMTTNSPDMMKDDILKEGATTKKVPAFYKVSTTTPTPKKEETYYPTPNPCLRFKCAFMD